MEDIVNISPYDIVTNNATCSDTTELLRTMRYQELQKFHRNPLSVKYIMSPDDTVLFNKYMGTRHYRMSNNPGTNSHAISANLQHIAYQRCIKYAENFKTAIDIGGTPLRTPNEHHLCTLISNCREEARYALCNNLKLDSQLTNLHNINRKFLCINGAENCNYQAEYGYMINVYDVTLDTIAIIMNKHDIRVLDVWMFLPLMLSDTNNTTDQEHYKCEITPSLTGFLPKKPNVIFSLKDSNNVYRHDYETWRRYLTTTMIRGRQGCAIAIEHIEKFGTFTNIRFTKTWARTGVIERNFPLDVIMKDYVMFPSISEFMKRGRWISSKNDKFIQNLNYENTYRPYSHNDKNRNAINGAIYRHFYVVEANFITSIRDYANSLNKQGFTFETINAYCNAKKTSVVYERGSKLVMIHKGLSATTNIYQKLVMDIFLQCSIDRYNRTQTITKNMNRIKSYDGFWEQFCDTGAQFLTDLFGKRNMHKQLTENQIFTGRLLDLRPMYYRSVVYCRTHEVPLIIPQVINHIKMTVTSMTIVPGSKLSSETDSTVLPILTPAGFVDSVSDIDFDKVLESTDKFEKEKDRESKLILPDINQGQDLEFENDVPQHGKIVNVKADGYCGLHTLKHFGLENFHTYSKSVLEAGFLTLNQIVALCREKDTSVLIHTNSQPWQLHNVGTSKHININWTGVNSEAGHWEPIICNCDRSTATNVNSYIGFYRNIPIKENCLYINCANQYLTDGDGQAKDFNYMFKGYKDKIVTPIPTTRFLKYKGIHLGLVVAYNNTIKKDVIETNRIYSIIIKAIDNYAFDNELTVYLPMIGTALFGGDMCCFRKHIKTMRSNVVLCYLKDNMLDDYNHTLDCLHGGGIILHQTNNLKNMRTRIQDNDNEVTSRDYKQIIPNKIDSPMLKKINDILSIIGADRNHSILEISAAPGGFKRYYPCIISGHYTPGEPFKHGKPEFKYNNLKTFMENVPHISYVHAINDNPIDNENLTEEAIKLKHIMEISPELNSYTFKYLSANGAIDFKDILSLKPCSAITYSTNGTRNTSSELYTTLFYSGLRHHQIHNKVNFKHFEYIPANDHHFFMGLSENKNYTNDIDPNILMTYIDRYSFIEQRESGKTCVKKAFKASDLQSWVTSANSDEVYDLLDNFMDEHIAWKSAQTDKIKIKTETKVKVDKVIFAEEVEINLIDFNENNDMEPYVLDDTFWNNITSDKQNKVASELTTIDNISETKVLKSILKHKETKHESELSITDGLLDIKEEIKEEPEIINGKEKEETINTCKHNMKFFEHNANINATVYSTDINNQINVLITDKCIRPSTIEIIKQIIIPEEVNLTIKADIGVGGAGKTMKISKNSCYKCIKMISPYRSQKEEMNITQGNGYCQTFVAVLNDFERSNVVNIVLDEIYAHNFTMVAIYTLINKHLGKKEVTYYGTGDDKQIKAINWNGTLTKGTTEYIKPYKLTTHRNPQSIVDICSNYIPGMTTTKKHDFPIMYKPSTEITKVKSICEFGEEVILCFTQAMMKIIQETTKMQVMTVTMAHGKTFDTVHLYATDLCKLPSIDRVAQMYTGVSRVSRQLIVYGEKGDLDILTTLQGSALERALETSNNKPLGGAIILKKEVKIEHYGDDHIRLKLPDISTELVTEILNKAYKQCNALNPNIVDHHPFVLPNITSNKKFKTNIDMITPKDTTIIGRTLSKFKSYNRLYNSSSTRKAMGTFVGRYANREIRHTSKKYTELFIKGIEKFLKPNYKRIAENNLPEPEIIWKHCCDALKTLQSKFPKEYRKVLDEADDDYFSEVTPDMIEEMKIDIKFKKDFQKMSTDVKSDDIELDEASDRDKNYYLKRRTLIVKKFIELVIDPNADANKYKDLEMEFNTDHHYHRSVSFHLKSQPKNIMKDGYDTKDKYGQGVSAWTKMANIVCSGYIRHFDDLLPHLIKENVQIAYNSSDKALQNFFLQYSNEILSKSTIKFLNDFTEFDSSQEKCGIQALFFMYSVTGMNKFTMDFMYSMRSNWVLSLRCPDDVFIHAYLEGEYQQHSGQVHTLGSNTVYNMAAIGMCYVFKDVIFASFKGDDSFILCRGYEQVMMDGIPISDQCGFKMKVETPEIAEFIANIVTDQGFVPDLLRRTSRIVSKVYRDKDDWEQIKLSTADALSVLPERNLYNGLCWLKQYYKQCRIDMSIDDLEVLWFYLRKLTKSDISILGMERELWFMESYDTFPNV